MLDVLDFTVVLEPQPEGGFTVTVPALPEVMTEGDSEVEAMAMAEDAIRLVLAYRREHGIPLRGVDWTIAARRTSSSASTRGQGQAVRTTERNSPHGGAKWRRRRGQPGPQACRRLQ